MSSNPTSQYLDQCRRVIAEHGHMVQHVGGDATTPPFAYTVGRTPHGQPELVLVGVDPTAAHGVLNDLVRLADTDTISAGVERSDVLADGYPVTLVAVTPQHIAERLHIVRVLYPDYVVEALQVVYTDTSHRYPWQPGYDLDPRVQPLLGRPPSDTTGSGGRPC